MSESSENPRVIVAEVWALDHPPIFAYPHLYATAEDAKKAGEDYVRTNTQRTDVGALEWRTMEGDEGLELWGSTTGSTLSADMFVFPMHVTGPRTHPMPQPPGPDHVIPADGRPEPDPFDFDFEAAEQRHHLRVRDHWNDTAPPWPLERLREYNQLADTLPGHTDAAPLWQETNARVADIRGAFDHIAGLERRISEARHLAEVLLEFLRSSGALGELALVELAAFNADMTLELLPRWLTAEPDGPEAWQTPYADDEAQREAGMDATFEHDPDLGKDLDYDDEYEG